MLDKYLGILKKAKDILRGAKSSLQVFLDTLDHETRDVVQGMVLLALTDDEVIYPAPNGFYYSLNGDLLSRFGDIREATLEEKQMHGILEGLDYYVLEKIGKRNVSS